MNITPRELSVRYHVSVPTIYRWHREGKLPAGVRLGKRVLRFNAIDIKDWEERKWAHDRTEYSQADVEGGSGVLSALGAHTGSGESESQGPTQRTARAKSIFALDAAEEDFVHQPAERSEEHDLPGAS